MAATNKCLAQSNKSRTGGKATKKREIWDPGSAVTIALAILEHYPDLNDAQREVVAHLDGPLLVVAGPGSGKTYSIVLRALNLLLLEIAAAKEIVLCTFTDKAAFEMRDRLSAAAQRL
jgi:DNA helicase II / ATP-dependent DNA helicase PcrA